MEIIVQFLEYHRFSARLLSQIVLDGKKKLDPQHFRYWQYSNLIKYSNQGYLQNKDILT